MTESSRRFNSILKDRQLQDKFMVSLLRRLPIATKHIRTMPLTSKPPTQALLPPLPYAKATHISRPRMLPMLRLLRPRLMLNSIRVCRPHTETR